MESLIIRADASTQIGTGHLMRCLALAQAWKDSGGEVTFITACQGEGLIQRLRDEEFDIKLLSSAYPDTADWNFTRDILAGHPGALVVLDGYHFDEVYQRQVRQAGHRLLVIDDIAHLKHYCADILLNQNLHAEQLHYSCEPYTRLLLGTRYVLLRREFLEYKNLQRETPEIAKRLLVTFGGSDPKQYTLIVIEALQTIDVAGLEATVVIGDNNLQADVVETTARQSSIPIRLVRDARNIPELMAAAHLTVAAAGSTTWELAFMAAPMLLVVVSDNQAANAKALRDTGSAIILDPASVWSATKISQILQQVLHNKELRKTMSQVASTFVDGLGASRVVEHIMPNFAALSETAEEGENDT